MLARKAVVGQVKGDMLVIAQGRRRSANVALDLSPMMWQVVYGIAALVACLLIMMVMNAYSTKLGYEVVKTCLLYTSRSIGERYQYESWRFKLRYYGY